MAGAGRPRTVTPGHVGWYLILSREALLWRATQPNTFRAAIPPERPGPAPEGPDEP